MSLVTPDSGLLVWMVLIFGILFLILAKFGFPMITGMVDKRSERINAAIAKAEEAERSLAALSEQQTQMIQQAKQEQARILKDASEAGRQIVAKAKEEAARESAAMLEHAKTQIAAERESAMQDIRRQVSLLSVEVAEKVIRKNLEQTSDQLALLDKLFDETAGLKDRS